MDSFLRSNTQAWIDGDPDPETTAELTALLASEAWDELAERMNGTLRFGTGGLRGAVEGGSNRMNRAVIIKATKAIADLLLERHGGPPFKPVALGFDARLSSKQFAADTIGVLTAAGISVQYFPTCESTPVVAFAALRLESPMAIVVTASHNPPQDNGYKVFDSNGAQIVPPVDTEVADLIAGAAPAISIPRDEIELSVGNELAHAIGPELFEEYLAAVASAVPNVEVDVASTIVYTPMHGVGGAATVEALRRSGHYNVIPVPEQFEPDGKFPTVEFPNPEEPGALDLAMALGIKNDADLILANDPDTDRLAVVVRLEGGWRKLTGNEIGALLGDYVLRHWDNSERAIVSNSVVSSPQLADIAAGYGAHFEQTLTGFKWIANAAMDLEAQGVGLFAFGFEEAIGYSVGSTVRDKDGISAAVAFADLAGECRLQGVSVLDRLDEISRRHGLWVSVQRSLTRPGSGGAAEIAKAMSLLQAEPPKEVGVARVARVADYSVGSEDRPRWLPATSLVVLHLDGGGRVLVRPSGTEPKIKFYVDLRTVLPDGADARQIESEATAEASAIAGAMVTYLGLAT
jgi:phosphomannomutase